MKVESGKRGSGRVGIQVLAKRIGCNRFVITCKEVIKFDGKEI